MNIKNLTYFIEVVRKKGFTNASKELFVSQPVLSKTVKLLEDELEMQLIDRSAKTFTLTEEGAALYEAGEAFLRVMDEQMERVYDNIHHKKRKLSVGIPPVISTAYFTPIIYEYRKRYPQVNLRIVEEGANRVRDRVDEGSIDIGVVILPFENRGNRYKVTPAMDSENVLLVHKDHPFAGRREIAFRELAEETFISLNSTYMLYNRILDICSDVGFTPNIAYETSQWDFVAEMVSLNQGVAILPKPIVKRFYSKDIRTIALREPEFPWNIAMISRQEKYVCEPMRQFIDLVKEMRREVME